MKDAISFENITGISGLNLSARQLMMRMKVLRRDQKREQIQLAEAFLVAQHGDKNAWEEFCKT
ncbi:hypothetical protein AAIB41_02580 [Brucella sp. BE17]|uniref:hypothetical protein n=1 Tax=Brucella sp. BE17 TaxID=3142977 RepID=UPI0031BB0CCA